MVVSAISDKEHPPHGLAGSVQAITVMPMASMDWDRIEY
jgi:hypothetical protein